MSEVCVLVMWKYQYECMCVGVYIYDLTALLKCLFSHKAGTNSHKAKDCDIVKILYVDTGT